MAAASFDGDVRHSGSGGGALGVHGASRKIGKTAAQAQAQAQQQQQRKPVIIYMVSPKVIHVEAHEFMSLVQRLTGPDAGGEKKMASTPSSPRPSDPRKDAGRAAPVRVKACAVNRPGPAVSVSVTATRQHAAPSAAGPGPGPSPSPSGFLFHDLSPLRGAALKGEAPLVSPGWLHHVGDHFLSPGAPSLGSPSAFLDIFWPFSSQHQ